MNMVDFSTMDGLQVLVYLLTHKEGAFLWYIMIVGILLFLISVHLDKDSKVSKHIDPNDQYH